MPVELIASGKNPKPHSALRGAIPAADADALLVAAAKGGDRHAFDKLADRHMQKIFLLANRITRSREDAEEVVQDSLIQAFVHLESFNGDSRFSTWLTRIAVNQSLMMLRKRRQSRVVSLEECTEGGESSVPLQIPDRRATPEQRVSQDEMRDILFHAVDRLPAGLRAAVQLRELQELTTEEATQVLGLTVSALKSRLYHARCQLRLALAPHFQSRREGTAGSAWNMPALQPGAPCGN